MKDFLEKYNLAKSTLQDKQFNISKIKKNIKVGNSLPLRKHQAQFFIDEFYKALRNNCFF